MIQYFIKLINNCLKLFINKYLSFGTVKYINMNEWTKEIFEEKLC